jgi:hypothetical protein
LELLGNFILGLERFLTNLTQSVKISSNLISQPSSVTSGVVQGSVLGPILYAAYTNDIVHCFSHGKPILYADDLKVVFPIDLLNPQKSYNAIMSDLNNLSLWSAASGLNFNFNKCFVMHYGSNNPNFAYHLCGQLLLSTNSTSDLGVLRTTNLSYDEHYTNLIRRANCMCAYILRTFANRNSVFMARVFVAYVRPILEYACQLWSPSTVNLINRIERVQRLFTKRIRSIAHLSYNERLSHLHLHRLESRRLYLDLLFLCKLKFNCLHLTLADFCVFISRLHNNRFISIISFSRSTYYFFTARTVRLWNSLHRDITSARNFVHFRRLLSHVNFTPYLRGRA